MRIRIFLLGIMFPIFAQAGQTALTGELGALKRTDGTGRVSDEMSLTVHDPRLNGGRSTNIPLLVKGQVDVDKLLKDKQPKPSQRQVEIAIARAAERVAAGADLPSYDSEAAAIAAAKARSESRAAEFAKKSKQP